MVPTHMHTMGLGIVCVLCWLPKFLQSGIVPEENHKLKCDQSDNEVHCLLFHKLGCFFANTSLNCYWMLLKEDNCFSHFLPVLYIHITTPSPRCKLKPTFQQWLRSLKLNARVCLTPSMGQSCLALVPLPNLSLLGTQPDSCTVDRRQGRNIDPKVVVRFEFG